MSQDIKGVDIGKEITNAAKCILGIVFSALIGAYINYYILPSPNAEGCWRAELGNWDRDWKLDLRESNGEFNFCESTNTSYKTTELGIKSLKFKGDCSLSIKNNDIEVQIKGYTITTYIDASKPPHKAPSANGGVQVLQGIKENNSNVFKGEYVNVEDGVTYDWGATKVRCL